MNHELYRQAIHFAVDHHGDQMYGDIPYIHHLLAVERQLYIYNYHPMVDPRYRKVEVNTAMTLLLGCILHDVIEDTDATKETVAEAFGIEVAELIYAVTNEPGESRKERFAKTYPKIAANSLALIVKLCDRIANFESCLSHRLTKDRQRLQGLLEMYQREHPGFTKALYKEGKQSRMWEHLNFLAHGL